MLVPSSFKAATIAPATSITYTGWILHISIYQKNVHKNGCCHFCSIICWFCILINEGDIKVKISIILLKIPQTKNPFLTLLSFTKKYLLGLNWQVLVSQPTRKLHLHNWCAFGNCWKKFNLLLFVCFFANNLAFSFL